MTALNRFALDVLHDVSGAPGPLVEREVRFAAIEFCDYTLAWRSSLADIAIVADTNEYAFVVPSESRVSSVFYAGHDDIRVLPTTERTLDDTQENWRSADATAEISSWYYLPDRETVRLALTPEAVGVLELKVSLKPTQDAKNLPDFLYNDHLEAIRAGTLARLLAQPGKDYSNPQLGGYFKMEFEKLKRKERAERWNDYTRQSTLYVGPVAYVPRGGR